MGASSVLIDTATKMRGGLYIAGLALCLVGNVGARFVIEQGGLKIAFPKEKAREHPNGFDMSLANFGSPRYGGELRGKLVYPNKEHTCTPSCNYACQDFSQASPPYNLRSGASDTTYIMLVDRGPIEDGFSPCKFAEKVWHAQLAGAHGVIVVNYEDKQTTMEAPNDQDETLTYLKNITIPAAFIQKSDGDVLKDLVAGADTYVVLDWKDVLPRTEKVHWEFWTNSNDQCGALCDLQKEFIKEFVPVARELENANYTAFTPHYIVWVCPDAYRDSDECQSQCIHHGRYCTPDPDGDLGAGYSGRDIVQENLRQLCVYKLSNASGKPWVWWDYVTKFGEQCQMKDQKYNEDCAEEVFRQVNVDEWASLSQLKECIGDMHEDADNPLMEEEMARQRGGGDTGEVYILPTIRINDGQYRGKLAYSEVLRAICAAFNKGSEPQACLGLSEDNCREGSAGAQECAANKNTGKTACQSTFSGYKCTCGSGFISHINDAGEERCLNINECVSTAQRDLDPKCTCERCACQDTYGGYHCIENLPDECANDYGGCWHKEYTINNQKKTISACKDQLELYKDAAAKGKSTEELNEIKLHVCTCPPCFTEFMNNGQMECVPKCDLNHCDEPTGICNVPVPGSSGSSVGVFIFAVIACLVIVGTAGYAVYRLRIRSAMHQEIRAIMAQYMPLESQDLPENHSSTTPATNGNV